jgi:phospholipid/cholesterol/gamma-HCH transport system ATP-binding protein
MTRLKIDAVSKQFGSLTALDNVSLSLEAGRSLALIGPTAAGKSVLLKLIVGLYGSEQGRLLSGGR